MFNKRQIEELEGQVELLKTEGLEKAAKISALQAENTKLGELGALDALTLQNKIEDLKVDKQNAEDQLSQLSEEIQLARTALVTTEDLAILQEVGIYEFSNILDTAVAYQDKIKALDEKIKSANMKAGGAIQAATSWTVNGSASEGQKMIREFSKLMLRAYNSEVDDAIRSLKPYKVANAIDRLNKVRETIEKLGKTMSIRVSNDYHKLRIQEIQLTGDFLQKQAEEKEAQKAERERLKEEAQAQKEFETEKNRLMKELSHHESVLQQAQKTGNIEAAESAQAKMEEVQKAVQGVEERAANIRAGYVYVISNIGSFGEEVIKIGLTRRIEYEDRIHELSDASVPFVFDIHAVVFSNDAVSLEKKLHGELESLRMNKVNTRKEFFRSTPSAVKEILEKLAGEHLLVYNEAAEAADWRISTQVPASTI